MPPAAGAPGLGVTRVLAAGFDGRSEASLHPDLRVFAGDLVRPYGLPLREDLLREGVGHDYGEMGEDLVRRVADGQPADLLILAFSSPDVRPGAPSALHLSRHCPGTPQAFAVCDQGSAAAFTALRLAAAHHRTGGCRRAVVVLAEQSALHYRPAAPVELPERHRAVVLLCEETTGEGLAVRQSVQRDPALARAAVRAEHAALGPDARLLLAAGLAGSRPDPATGPGRHHDPAADHAPAAGPDPTADPARPDPTEDSGEPAEDTGERTRAAAPGQPFTGLWTLLAEELAAADPAADRTRGPLLLADHDHRLGRLSTLTLP